MVWMSKHHCPEKTSWTPLPSCPNGNEQTAQTQANVHVLWRVCFQIYRLNTWSGWASTTAARYLGVRGTRAIFFGDFTIFYFLIHHAPRDTNIHSLTSQPALIVIITDNLKLLQANKHGGVDICDTYTWERIWPVSYQSVFMLQT